MQSRRATTALQPLILCVKYILDIHGLQTTREERLYLLEGQSSSTFTRRQHFLADCGTSQPIRHARTSFNLVPCLPAFNN
jgi:hypothetical protein